MTPEQIAALTAIAAIVAKVGTWEIGSIIFSIVFGPWIMMYFVSRSMEKRLNAAIVMYENSNKLVQKYEKMSSEHVDTIRLSTAATVELTKFLRDRVPCFQRMAERQRQISS
jgi:transcriptional regulator of nitric oxide reductase